MNQELIEKVNIEKIAQAGSVIYQKIKGKYEPQENGKFLAIEVETGHAFLADTGVVAAEQAKAKFPGKVFYLVKVGYDTVETMARAVLKGNY